LARTWGRLQRGMAVAKIWASTGIQTPNMKGPPGMKSPERSHAAKNIGLSDHRQPFWDSKKGISPPKQVRIWGAFGTTIFLGTFCAGAGSPQGGV
jgi:hypothetical protein